DRADRTAGDDARTGAGRTQQHVARARVADHAVRDAPVHQRDPDQALLRPLVALADRVRHLVGLAEAHPDVTLAVTDDDERAEAEAPAALDDLGDAVDVDHPLLEILERVGIDDGPHVVPQKLRPASRAP